MEILEYVIFYRNYDWIGGILYNHNGVDKMTFVYKFIYFPTPKHVKTMEFHKFHDKITKFF